MASLIENMVRRLEDSAGKRLESVVLYGAAAHGDYEGDEHHHYLMIVLQDLSLRSVELVAGPIRWWLKHDEPMPRLFSPASIRDSADVFPIELLDITAYHLVVHGKDPLADLVVSKDHLRLQCEREIREKHMRLQEAYIEAAGREKYVSRVMAESYLVFTRIFRGCLHLMDDGAPKHDLDVVKQFCRRTEIDLDPFEQIHAMVGGARISSDVDELFARYYAELSKAVEAVDRFDAHDGGTQ